MKIKTILLFTTILCLSRSNSNAQVYDGANNKVFNVGAELSNYNYVVFGGDVGLTDYLSWGVNLRLLLNPPDIKEPDFLKRLGGYLKMDYHAANALKLKKSDILIGYKVGLDISHGPQATYQYFFTDFFGLYGKASYYFNYPKDDEYYLIKKPDQFTYEFGFVYKNFGTIF